VAASVKILRIGSLDATLTAPSIPKFGLLQVQANGLSGGNFKVLECM